MEKEGERGGIRKKKKKRDSSQKDFFRASTSPWAPDKVPQTSAGALC